jgi:hypothetical protein
MGRIGVKCWIMRGEVYRQADLSPNVGQAKGRAVLVVAWAAIVRSVVAAMTVVALEVIVASVVAQVVQAVTVVVPEAPEGIVVVAGGGNRGGNNRNN